MKYRDSVTDDGESRLEHAIRHLGRDDIERAARANAARIDFPVDDRHLAVVRSLIEHYRHDGVRLRAICTGLTVRVLEEAYAFLGGAAYLYELFGVAGARALLARIHRLAGLPLVDDFDATGHLAGPPGPLCAG